ncbi:hypothetical protein [Nonomuraea sp. NPDC050310]|uniref:hypothetical protein n=1 Tax=Nonomuraea sp. NPDC050310 TaxID=3154935 RepID=UPI0033D6A0CF
MEAAGVRYLVHDVERAVEFHTELSGIAVVARPGSDFAVLQLGGLRLYANAMQGEGGSGRHRHRAARSKGGVAVHG